MLNRAKMLNKRASNKKFKADEIIERLNIELGSTIADIGCGGGFYSMKFSSVTGNNGKVYAVDTNNKLLKYIQKETDDKQIKNIEPILMENELTGINEHSCDLIFLRNVYHHINDTRAYFTQFKPYLKGNGKIAIIDYKKTNRRTFMNFIERYPEEKDIVATMKACGYEHIASYNFLEEQSFNIFQIKSHL